MNNFFDKAISKFDALNTSDPNFEYWDNTKFPKELLYSIRMTDTLKAYSPNASESVLLAARSQHICRWEISRDSYEMTRAGYLTWRRDLSKFHAKKAAEILMEVGYDKETIDTVTFLLQKKQLKKNEDSQLLEDVVCLVFLEYYFDKFSKKYSEQKLIDILQRTWIKMSDRGQKAALKLNLSSNTKYLIGKALKNKY